MYYVCYVGVYGVVFGVREQIVWFEQMCEFLIDLCYYVGGCYDSVEVYEFVCDVFDQFIVVNYVGVGGFGGLDVFIFGDYGYVYVVVCVVWQCDGVMYVLVVFVGVDFEVEVYFYCFVEFGGCQFFDQCGGFVNGVLFVVVDFVFQGVVMFVVFRYWGFFLQLCLCCGWCW